jgi:hypothetical protein
MTGPFRLALAITLVIPHAVRAQPIGLVVAVKPIPGYRCAKLDVKNALDFSAPPVWILDAPEPNAAHGTAAGSVLFVKTPEHRVNGYFEVIQVTGKPGWLPVDKVRPFDPNARCVPSLLSNGRVGAG